MIQEIAAAVREEPGVSVQDAKRELLEFGEQQSKQLHETLEMWHDRINDTVDGLHAKVKHAAPYAAAAAAGVGFILGKRRPKRRREEPEPEPEHRSAKSVAVGWMLRTLGPLALEMVAKMRAKHHQQRPSDTQEPDTRDEPAPAV